jgi:hypothetical protein
LEFISTLLEASFECDYKFITLLKTFSNPFPIVTADVVWVCTSRSIPISLMLQTEPTIQQQRHPWFATEEINPVGIEYLPWLPF